MSVRTRQKILLARIARSAIMLGRRLAGRGAIVDCRRAGVNWRLDLNEGIDFSIFLLGAFERRTLAAYRRLIPPRAVVIDIGANIGAHTLPMADCVGDGGRVIAVEPTEWAFRKLMMELSLNPALAARVMPLQVMLVADDRRGVPEAIPSSWPLRSPSGAHAGHGGVAKSTRGARARTLDDLVDELGLRRLDLIKLDVDGFELDVLRGGGRTLERFGPIILFEHSPYCLVEKGYSPDELTDCLLGAGYRFHDLSGALLPQEGRWLPDVPFGAGVNIIATRAAPGGNREGGGTC